MARRAAIGLLALIIFRVVHLLQAINLYDQSLLFIEKENPFFGKKKINNYRQLTHLIHLSSLYKTKPPFIEEKNIMNSGATLCTNFSHIHKKVHIQGSAQKLNPLGQMTHWL